MSYGKIHRSESHALSTTPALRQDVERTISAFRRAVRLLATLALTRWPTLGPLNSKARLTALEALFHATSLNPTPKYAVLDKVLGKMPSYLRRAAVNAACGVRRGLELPFQLRQLAHRRGARARHAPAAPGLFQRLSFALRRQHD